MTARSGFFTEVDGFLLQRARRGDVDAVEGLYRSFRGPVYNLARRMCGCDELADEILQDTFLEVVKNLGSYRGEGAFGAWLRRIAVSKVLMRQRRARVRRIEVADDDAAAGVLEPTEPCWDARFDVERALARLPETGRLVVWLYHVEGMTHPEIARLLGRTTSFSKSQLQRSQGRLRSWLESRGSEIDEPKQGRIVGVAGR